MEIVTNIMAAIGSAFVLAALTIAACWPLIEATGRCEKLGGAHINGKCLKVEAIEMEKHQ